jgi:asparagine synthase (glutamine-hydrolysing)
VESSRYFDVRLWEAQLPLCPDGFMQEFSATFRRILPAYLTSPSQIGISITGGLDTRLIMACLPAGRVPSISYTYAGEVGETLDCRIGARVASVRGLPHCVLRIGHDFLRDYRSHVDRTVYLTDGAAGALQAHEIYFSTLARQLAPIRLTGNFGSEVLRGMSTFKPMELDLELVDPQFRGVPHDAASEEAPRTAHPVTHAVFQEIPWHLFGTVAAVRTQLAFRTPYLDNELVQLAYRAPAELRRSSAPALRLLRDNDPRLSFIPTDRGVSASAGRLRSLARRSAAEVTFKLDYLHKEGLPGWLSPFDAALDALSSVGLLGWHKFLPYRGWFRRELAGSIAAVFDDAGRRGLPFFDRRYLASMVPAHVKGRRNHLRAIHTVATLEAVDRLLLRDSASGPIRHA